MRLKGDIMLTSDDLKDIPYTPEATTVIGDMNLAYWYIRSGRALRDWNNRIVALEKGFDAYIKDHPTAWNYIISHSPEPPKKCPDETPLAS